jgi:hypothetical protein
MRGYIQCADDSQWKIQKVVAEKLVFSPRYYHFSAPYDMQICYATRLDFSRGHQIKFILIEKSHYWKIQWQLVIMNQTRYEMEVKNDP